MHLFWVDFGKSKFWSIFDFFIRGYITFVEKKKWSKNKVFWCERQLIGNIITSLTRYDIPYLDNYFYFYDKNKVKIWIFRIFGCSSLFLGCALCYTILL